MARWLRQSTQVCACVGPFIKVSDGITAVAGADVVSGGCRLKKNNANWVPAKSDVFTNEDGGGPFFEVALSAGDVDTLGLLRWTCYPSAAFSIFQVWEDFMVVDPVTYDAYFGTGPIRADVNVWNHTSVASHAAGVPVVDVLTWEHVSAASVVVSANVGQWRGTVVSAPTTSGSIPVDVVYWNHGSVAGIVTAGAPSINLVTWAGSPVSAMPGAPGAVAGSVDVSSWGGKAVGAITTAGAIPVDIMYVNHTASAGNAGLLSVNVLQWASAGVTAATTGAAIPVDVVYWNHGSVAGIVTAGAPSTRLVAISNVSAEGVLQANVASISTNVLVSANVAQWRGTVPNVLNVGNVMADLQMWAHSSASAMPGAPDGVAGSVNVNMWAGTSVAAVVTAGWPQVEVASYAPGEAPLQPTVAGRTLDVSTGGEAGVDWANVGTPGSTVNLAATTLGILGAASIGASSFAASAIDANALAASAVDEILDDTLEGTMTVRQALRIILSAVAGKLSGAATTNVLIRDIGDTKNRIDATVDAAGDRTA